MGTVDHGSNHDVGQAGYGWWCGCIAGSRATATPQPLRRPCRACTLLAMPGRPRVLARRRDPLPGERVPLTAAALVVVGVGLCAWWGVWRGAFVFDDHPAIVENQALQAGDWWRAAFGEPHQPLANRPLACLSLVLDFQVFGKGAFGPHVTNLVLHLTNALLLLATLRRALLAPNLGDRFDTTAALWTATAVACLWVAHPLAGDAVAYATQRSTLLAGCFLLLTLFAATREIDSLRPWRWRSLALAAMACGMASKEDFVTAPILYVLFERAFVVPSWSLLRSRTWWYASLAATWSVLALCVASGPSNPTVGYHTTPPISAFEWLATQAGVVVQYVRLAAWPWPLRGAHGTDIVRDPVQAMLPGACVLVLLAVVIWCWKRRPWWGWLGALFFLCLAPSSTILPIQTEVMAERRAYLPMLLVIVPVVFLARRALARLPGRPWLAATLLVATLTILTVQTRERVAAHADDLSFWTDAHRKRDLASRGYVAGLILSNYAAEMWKLQRFDEAIAAIEESIGCEVSTAIALKQTFALQQRGRNREAVTLMRRILLFNPDDPAVLGTLGTCLVGVLIAERSAPTDPRFAEAESMLTRSLAAEPNRPEHWNSLGLVLRSQQRLADAERAYFRATELTHAHLQPYQFRGEMLVQLGRRAELAPMFEGLLGKRHGDVTLRLQVGELLLGWREFALAAKVVQDALRLDPQNERALEVLRRLPH